MSASASEAAPPRLPPTAAFVWRLSTFHPLPQVASGLCWVAFHSWPLFPGLLAPVGLAHNMKVAGMPLHLIRKNNDGST